MLMKGLKRCRTYTIDEILPLIGKSLVNLKTNEGRGHHVGMNTTKLKTLKSTTKCLCCGLQGQFFALEISSRGEFQAHLNLYGYNEFGEEVALTVDHIIPRSMGGINSVENIQILCAECNQLKADKILSIVDLKSIRKSNTYFKMIGKTSQINCSIQKLNRTHTEFRLYQYRQITILIAKSVIGGFYEMAILNSEVSDFIEFVKKFPKEDQQYNIFGRYQSYESAIRACKKHLRKQGIIPCNTPCHVAQL